MDKTRKGHFSKIKSLMEENKEGKNSNFREQDCKNVRSIADTLHRRHNFTVINVS